MNDFARPIPGPPTPADVPAIDVDPAQITSEVDDLLEQVDRLRAEAGSREASGGDISDADLSALTAQADLLGQAHDVLSGALEQIDRV